jgi:hypothetical protein
MVREFEDIRRDGPHFRRTDRAADGDFYDPHFVLEQPKNQYESVLSDSP